MNTKIANSPFPNKTVLQKCLQGLLRDDEESSASASADWIDAVDRGGQPPACKRRDIHAVLCYGGSC